MLSGLIFSISLLLVFVASLGDISRQIYAHSDTTVVRHDEQERFKHIFGIYIVMCLCITL